MVCLKGTEGGVGGSVRELETLVGESKEDKLVTWEPFVGVVGKESCEVIAGRGIGREASLSGVLIWSSKVAEDEGGVTHI